MRINRVEREHSLMTTYMLNICFLSAIVSVLSFAQVGGDPSGNPGSVLAEVDGTKLTLGDFERKRPSGLFNARNSFYEAERKAVDEFIEQYLLERQAQKEHVSVSELLE